MSKLSRKGNWKAVELDSNIFKGEIDGLVGIEECTDYDIDTIRQQSRKRKQTSKNDIPTRDAKRKKTNLKKTETVAKEQEESEDDDYCSALPIWNSYGVVELLLKAIKELGFNEPTEIQSLSIPPAILNRRDILGAAETGSGKTLAFGIPILNGILKIKNSLEKEEESDFNASDSEVDESGSEEEHENEDSRGCVKVVRNIEIQNSSPRKPLYALILTPTRELAIQVKDHLVAVAKYTDIKIAVVLGGMAMEKQERILSKGPEIVVATPGRLWELIQNGNAHLSQIDKIRFLAIDETDRMMEKGHFQELHSLIEKININENRRKRRQNFVFSATLTLVHDLPQHLALKKKIHARKSKKIKQLTSQQKLNRMIDFLGITNPKIVDVTKKTGTAETLSECRIICDLDEKDFYVYYFLQKHPGRTLIFCNSIGCVKRLVTLLGLLNCNPLPLHASMQQRQRLKNLDRFRDRENAILVATDVAARGLDIPSIEHVLHYQTPRSSESYVHRSGRTARASNEGLTILMMDPSELQNYLRVCKTLGRTEDLPLFPVQEKFLQSVKERVKLARQLDQFKLRVSKTTSESNWLNKAANEMDIIIDDNLSSNYDNEESHSMRKAMQVKQKQLSQLLLKPVFPKGFSGKYPLVSNSDGVSFYSNEVKDERAVEVLKSSLSKVKKGSRNKAKWLFRGKKKEIGQSSSKDNNKQQKGKKIK